MEIPIVIHVNLPDYNNIEDLSVMVIEQIWKDNIWLHRLQKKHWIETLETVHSNGKNLDPG